MGWCTSSTRRSAPEREILAHPQRQCGDYGFSKLVCAGFPADIVSGVLCLAINRFKSCFDATGSGPFAEIVEHQDAAHQEGGWIRKALASDIRRRAVDGFKNRAVIADIPAGNNSETAYEPCRKIAHYVAIEVREEQDIELLRIQNNLHARIVNNHLFVFDFGKFGSNGANRPEKQAVRELHDVGFVNGVNFLAALFFGVRKGKPRNARRSAFGDDFQAFNDSRHDFMLQAGIKVFRIFANDHDVYVFKARFKSRKILDGAKVRVEIKSLAQSDVHAGSAAGDGGGHRAFQCNAVTAHGLDCCLVQDLSCIAGAGAVGPCVDLFPIDLNAGRFQNAPCRARDFRADAFARQKRDLVSHRCIQLYWMEFGLSKHVREESFLEATATKFQKMNYSSFSATLIW